MKRPISQCMAAAALVWTAATANADQYVISHPGIALSPSDVKDIYLGEKQFAGPVKLVPLDNASSQERFLSRVLNLEKTKYATVWTKKAFREGLHQPSMKSGDSEIVELVKRTPGAVGYVSATPNGVNIVQKF